MKQFNIRVYGVAVNSENEVLLNKEVIGGKEVIKFPGGGLEWGEGVEDALKREFLEELDVSLTTYEVYYLTPFFQQSFFRKEDQIVSVYYKVSLERENDFRGEAATGKVDPNWTPIDSLKPDDFYFPIDKHVVKKLLTCNSDGIQP